MNLLFNKEERMADRLEYPLIIEAYGPENLKENVEKGPGELGWPRQLFGIDLQMIGEVDCDLEIVIIDAANSGNSMRFCADIGWYNRESFANEARKWKAKDERLSIRIHNAFFFAKPKGGYSTKYQFTIKH